MNDTDRLDAIEKELAEVRITLDLIRDTMVRTETVVEKTIATITPIIEDLKPTIEKLMEHPLVKMMAGGKRK
jgi:uncharacterized coiled-coil protein SlyX